MCYLNVDLIGLNNRCHPALLGVTDTQGVPKLHAHLKMLCNDLYTYKRKSEYQGGSPLCRLCKENSEDLEHILTSCNIYNEVRGRIIDEMEEICIESKSGVNFSEIRKNSRYLAQFILDCGSMNLPSRFNTQDTNMHKIFKLSRDLCYYMKKTRAEKLKNL